MRSLDELEALETETLYAEDIAKLLRVTPGSIRNQARECPEKLGFKVIVIGNRVLIPKAAFIAHMRGT